MPVELNVNQHYVLCRDILKEMDALYGTEGADYYRAQTRLVTALNDFRRYADRMERGGKNADAAQVDRLRNEIITLRHLAGKRYKEIKRLRDIIQKYDGGIEEHILSD